jgi:hypothetical protein
MKKTVFSITLLLLTSFVTAAEEISSNKDLHTLVIVHGVTGGDWD